MAELQITAAWEGGFRMRTEVRGHMIRSDEPAEHGGEDTGPTPTELFLASLASCLGMSLAFAARKQGFKLPDATVTVTGTYLGPRFQRIRVEVGSSHPRAEVEELLERAVRYCYVSNTFLTPPEMEFVVGPASRAGPAGEATTPQDAERGAERDA